jgi:hypothetical protein
MDAIVRWIMAATGRRRAVVEGAAAMGPTAAELRALAAAAGVELTEERAETLVPQVAAHFALLRALETVARPETEPAAELQLQTWRRDDD